MRPFTRLRRTLPGERGATAITVAISLLVLIGFTALAVDAGMGYNQRRDAQNAADNAALAAAWEACNPKVASSPNPTQAAWDVAALNGFDHTASNVTVTVTQVASGEYQVSISKTDPTTFGKVKPISAGTLTVTSKAVAHCTENPYLGGYAIFAGGTSACNGGVQLSLTGSSQIVNGGVHSNGDIGITGSSTTINGDVTYFGSSNYTPSTKLYGSPLSYPLSSMIDITDFQPGGSQAVAAGADYHNAGSTNISNNWMSNNGHATGSGGNIEITDSGIYYTSGNISLNGVTAAAGVKVTFVAMGTISLQGDGDVTAYAPITNTPNDPGLLMFSYYEDPASGGPTCTGNAVKWSVSNATWTGVIYAPNGQAQMSSSSNATVNGSIFAYTVNLSGSSVNISWQDNPNATPDFKVELLS